MSDEPGRLKEIVAYLFVGYWRQYQWGLLRLAEPNDLVKSLRVAHLELGWGFDGGCCLEGKKETGGSGWCTGGC